MNRNDFSKNEVNNLINNNNLSSFDVFRKICEELEEDGKTSYDLGSYTTIKMLPEADFLIHKSIGKNMVNQNMCYISVYMMLPL